MTTYTPEQLRQIDAQVAHILGQGHDVPAWAHEYTTSIKYAWRCIDYMRERGWLFSLDEYYGEPRQWVAAFSRHDSRQGTDPSAPLAICLAFLAANGVEARV